MQFVRLVIHLILGQDDKCDLLSTILLKVAHDMSHGLDIYTVT